MDWWWGEQVGCCAIAQVKEDAALDSVVNTDGGKESSRTLKVWKFLEIWKAETAVILLATDWFCG